MEHIIEDFNAIRVVETAVPGSMVIIKLTYEAGVEDIVKEWSKTDNDVIPTFIARGVDKKNERRRSRYSDCNASGADNVWNGDDAG